MKIQILTSPGCGHGARALDVVADVLRQSAPGAEVETITVASLEGDTVKSCGSRLIKRRPSRVSPCSP